MEHLLLVPDEKYQQRGFSQSYWIFWFSSHHCEMNLVGWLFREQLNTIIGFSARILM